MLRLFAWNVNGVRAAQRKGLLDWLHSEQPDILGLCETKAAPEQLDDVLRDPPGWHAYWASAERKGYSGTALLSRRSARQVQPGLGIEEFDVEGRTIVADYDAFVLLVSYCPIGVKKGHPRQRYKMRYYRALLRHCEALRARGRPVIFCGDINTAHRPVDLARPQHHENSTGFLPIERAWLDEVAAAGFVDSFRACHPQREDAYTFWSYRTRARERNIGWRFDYFFISPDLQVRLVDAAIHSDVAGSDHCPVSLTLDLDF
ncbi:MAG: exodeoxyribonuclease III [Anaerolineae bacterium]|nr:exodeoxyribonuclease III [Anaerolineae bacterium]